MENRMDNLKPTLKETNSRSIIKNLSNEIIEKAIEYLSDNNIIGLYIECNAPLKPKSHDSFSISNNKKPYVSLIAVYDEPKEKYKTSYNTVSFSIKNCDDFGNYDFVTYYSSSKNYDINKYKDFVETRASISLLRGIILFDKEGLLTESKENLPTVLYKRFVELYGEVQSIKINKVLLKRLPLIGTRI